MVTLLKKKDKTKKFLQQLFSKSCDLKKQSEALQKKQREGRASAKRCSPASGPLQEAKNETLITFAKKSLW